jgi:hypothetical protein
MFFAVIQQFQRTLRALDAVLGKAILHAEAKKFSPDNFCSARLAPDMLPYGGTPRRSRSLYLISLKERLRSRRGCLGRRGRCWATST